MNVSKIKSFFTVNKKSLFYAGFFLLSFFLCSDLAFAEVEKNPVDLAVKTANGILVIASALLGATTALASLFLTPEWVNGTLFGLDKYMKEIWILVSNIVYFIFAFILIAIAFMNIIGKGDKWELKAALPKFIVGVIMVPFTWFFVQFILSISAILTVGVLTLPYDTFQSNSNYQEAIDSMINMVEKPGKDRVAQESATSTIPKNYILDLSQGIKAGSGSAEGEGFFQTSGDSSLRDLLGGDNKSGHGNSIFGILSIYTYGVMQVQNTDTLNSGAAASDITVLADLTLKMIFDAILVLVYVILMIALFLALLVRGIKLWIYAMLSPVFGILYFFDKADGVGEGNGKFGIKDFISLALVPVYVSAALSFGLLFLMVAGHGMNTGKVLEDCPTGVNGVPTEQAKGAKCMSIGGFTFGIKGAHGKANSVKSDGTPGDIAAGAFGKLIMELFGIVILWIAIMTALKQNDITNKITEPIQQFGGSVGSLIAKSPMYAPIIPTGAGGMMSTTGLQQIGATAKSHYETQSRETGTSFIKQQGLFGQTVDLSNNSINAMTSLTNDGIKSESTWSGFSKAMNSANSTRELANNKNFVNLLREMLEKTGQADEATKIDSNDVNSIAAGIAVLDHMAETTYSGPAKDNLIGKKGDHRTAYSTFQATDLDKILKGEDNLDDEKPTIKPEIKLGNKTINVDATKDTSVIVKSIQDSGVDIKTVSAQSLGVKLKGAGLTDKKIEEVLKALKLEGGVDLDGDGDIDITVDLP